MRRFCHKLVKSVSPEQERRINQSGGALTQGGTTMADGVDLSRKFVSESELEERRKRRQEEWEKVRKPDDPEEVPEEEYDPRSLYERLQEQKEKKQEEYEEQFKFKNMVKGLDEDDTNFLDEVSRQQSLVEKQRRDEELQEIQEYRISIYFQMHTHCMPHHTTFEELPRSGVLCLTLLALLSSLSCWWRCSCQMHWLSGRRKASCTFALKKLAAGESQKKESEKRAGPKPPEHKTSHLSQAHLLAGAVKRRSSSQSSESSKKQKVEETVPAAAGNGSQTEQETGEQKPVPRAGVARTGVLHLPSAAVCVGILPGLGAYSGSSDSESSSDSEV
ncbi:hypothetical protein AOLI_G00097110 [Acnodon oligacanthus]